MEKIITTVLKIKLNTIISIRHILRNPISLQPAHSMRRCVAHRMSLNGFLSLEQTPTEID